MGTGSLSSLWRAYAERFTLPPAAESGFRRSPISGAPYSSFISWEIAAFCESILNLPFTNWLAMGFAIGKISTRELIVGASTEVLRA